MAVRAVVAGVQRQPEHADAVGLPRPEQRRRHRQVLVDARERHRLLEDVGPLRRRRLARRLSCCDAVRVRRKHPAHFVLRQLCEPGCPQRDQQRRRLLPVRIIRGIHDLLRADEPVQAEQVEGAPHGRVEEDAGLAAQPVGQRREVGDACVRDDQLRLGIAVDDPAEVIRDRRQSAAAVDQHRHAALGRELEDRGQPFVVEEELLRARMQLDASRAEVEAALRFADRVLGQVEPNERNQPPLRSRREVERAFVAGAETRVAVGLVEAEHEAARDPVLVHAADQVVVDAGHAVDVVPEVGVSVEDLSAVRQLAAELLVPLRHQFLRTLQRVVHGLESMCGIAGYAVRIRPWRTS